MVMGPTPPGTGVIAGGEVRAVLECAGVKDVLTNSQGSANVLNVVQATFVGLCDMKDPTEEARRRGKKLEEVQPFWVRRGRGDGPLKEKRQQLIFTTRRRLLCLDEDRKAVT